MTPSGWIRSSSSLLGRDGSVEGEGVWREEEVGGERGYVMPGADIPRYKYSTMFILYGRRTMR